MLSFLFKFTPYIKLMRSYITLVYNYIRTGRYAVSTKHFEGMEHTIRHHSDHKTPVFGLVVATNIHGEIGYKGNLLWHVEGDLPRFKDITTGNIIISGRVTHEGMPKVMKDRTRIVITGSLTKRKAINDPKNDIYAVSSFEEAVSLAVDLARACSIPYVYFVGGAGVYEEAMKMVDFALTTIVHKPVLRADTVIPDFGFPKEDWINHRSSVIVEDPDNDGMIVPSHTYMLSIRRRKES